MAAHPRYGEFRWPKIPLELVMWNSLCCPRLRGFAGGRRGRVFIFVNTWFTLAPAAATIEVEVRFYYLPCCSVRVEEYGPLNGVR